MQPVITRLQLFEALGSKIMLKAELCNFIKSKLGIENCSEEVTECLGRDLKDFVDNFNRRWKQAHRVKERFLSKYSDWLQKEIKFSKTVYDSKLTKNIINTPTPSTSTVGRPRKLFHESSDKSKRRKVQSLVSAHSEQELIHAAQVSLHKSGKRDAAKMVKETVKSPHRGTKIKKAYTSLAPKPVPLTSEEALSFFVDNNYTKNQYVNMRTECKKRNCNIFPAYHIIREAKKKCYPPNKSITITETSCTIKLQSLIDHTIERLAVIQEDVLKQTLTGNEKIYIIFKWGCDGSSGHSQYKQKFTDDDSSDSDLFVVSVVPLQLYSVHEGTNDKEILWQNPRPSSTRFCRPVKLLFEKETTELTRREVKMIESEIMSLKPTKIVIDGKDIQVNQKLLLTMVDGKICNAITGTSAQRCYVCGAGPKEMNNTTLSKTAFSVENYKFGLSTLHCWIRFFECLLHIAYKIEIEKWQARVTDDKKKVEKRKKLIINKFRSEMGLHVDQPRPGGSGTSNDGNTARRFFENPPLSSQITSINEELIRRFYVILCALSCPFPINTTAFKNYTQNTTNLYLKLYEWYYMPVTVHKVLVHGADIIDSCILPIGQLSEEAQEARNRDLRRYRLEHARKFSRKRTIEDVLHMLLVSSDPVISNKTKVPHKKKKELSSEVLSLLKEPDIPAHRQQEGESDCDSSDDSSGSSSDNE